MQPGYSSRKALEEPEGGAYKTCIARERGREGWGCEQRKKACGEGKACDVSERQKVKFELPRSDRIHCSSSSSLLKFLGRPFPDVQGSPVKLYLSLIRQLSNGLVMAPKGRREIPFV